MNERNLMKKEMQDYVEGLKAQVDLMGNRERALREENTNAQASMIQEYRQAVEATRMEAQEAVLNAKAAANDVAASVEASAREMLESKTRELNQKLLKEARENLELRNQVQALTKNIEAAPAIVQAAGGGQDPNDRAPPPGFGHPRQFVIHTDADDGDEENNDFDGCDTGYRLGGFEHEYEDEYYEEEEQEEEDEQEEEGGGGQRVPCTSSRVHRDRISAGGDVQFPVEYWLEL